MYRADARSPVARWAASSVLPLVLGFLAVPVNAQDLPPALESACVRLVETYGSPSDLVLLDDNWEEVEVEGCMAANDGAWFLSFEELGEGLRWGVHHISLDGTVAVFFPALHEDYARWANVEEGSNLSAEFLGEVQVSTIRDLNADGTDDIAVSIEHAGVEIIEQRHLLSFVNGAVGPMEIPMREQYRGVTNVDRDGRLDLVFASPFHLVWGCGDAGPDEYRPPPLFGHALSDGTFSTDDAVATLAVRDKCPALPEAFLVGNEYGELDVDATLTNLVCARYWGASADDVATQYLAELERATFDEPWCEPETETVLEMIRRQPAFTLE